ncbi:MAG: tripartite tricarboxylate transporter TctB family protein [Betaproteobacteria bacterium]|nr:tripartite tricarboxylate transporter TctB family protein [Betaproteobacteria bacterium]
MSSSPHPTPPATGAARRLIAGPTELAAGLFLLVVAALAWWFAQPLKVGTAYRMGPGYVPILLAWITGAFGAVLVLSSLVARGAALEKWRLRPMVLVLGSLVVFALCIERTGLLIASTLAVALAALAAPSPRLREIVLLALCMAGFACLLFPFALNLPLRILP